MPLFRLTGRHVKRISPQEHRIREDVIHRMIEDNLPEFFGDLMFVARKPHIGGKEFDTLAFNTATKSPVIVEYKREKDRGVVEQVDLYFVKLKNNQPDVMISSRSKKPLTTSARLILKIRRSSSLPKNLRPNNGRSSP